MPKEKLQTDRENNTILQEIPEIKREKRKR